MKAFIPVGGFGTRLYPLTYVTPKALCPVANEPLLRRILSLLSQSDFSEVIISAHHLAGQIQVYVESIKEDYEIKVMVTVEQVPLGKGGGLKLSEEYFDEDFFLINGDVLIEPDFTSLIQFHKQKQAMVTVLVAQADETARYGAVELDADGRILAWQEARKLHPQTRWVNTGVCVLKPEVLRMIPSDIAVSLEYDVFPELLSKGESLWGYPFRGPWIDIGTLESYLQANWDIVGGRFRHMITGKEVSTGVWVGRDVDISSTAIIRGPVAIGAGTRIGDNALLTGPCVIGSLCTVGHSAKIEKSVIWNEVHIGPFTTVSESILADKSIIGAECSLGPNVIVAHYSVIGRRNHLADTILGPGARISDR